MLKRLFTDFTTEGPRNRPQLRNTIHIKRYSLFYFFGRHNRYNGVADQSISNAIVPIRESIKSNVADTGSEKKIALNKPYSLAEDGSLDR